jgi:hypothetical protein
MGARAVAVAARERAMLTAAFLLAAVMDPTAAETPAPIQAPHVYLHPPTDACDSRAASDEVIVCGSKDADQRYRIKPDDNPRFVEKPVRAQVKLGNGTAGLAGQSASVGGFQSNRMMLMLKFPF